MKIIDLLNKIANEEEVPKKIKWEDTIFVYSEYDKDYLQYPFSIDEYKGLFCMKDSILTQFLNDELEIIEDTPIVHIKMTQEQYIKYLEEKLDTPKEDLKVDFQTSQIPNWVDLKEVIKIVNKNFDLLTEKTNRIIDKINRE